VDLPAKPYPTQLEPGGGIRLCKGAVPQPPCTAATRTSTGGGVTSTGAGGPLALFMYSSFFPQPVLHGTTDMDSQSHGLNLFYSLHDTEPNDLHTMPSSTLSRKLHA
jgi:hypothetical protein